jgi:hypothetical protein
MRLLLLFGLLLPGSPRPAAAQRLAWDGSVGASGTSWRTSAAAWWGVSLGDRIRLGVGPRLSRFGGDAKNYRTHDHSAGVPPRALLAPSVWALNLSVAGEIRLVGPLAAGANLDLAGAAAGASRTVSGRILEPARWSLFAYGDRDHGSLNSEFFLACRVGHQLQARAGISHFVTGYRVSEGATPARYLRFDTVPFLGLRWAP